MALTLLFSKKFFKSRWRVKRKQRTVVCKTGEKQRKTEIRSMDNKNTILMPLEFIKVEHNISDYYNNNEYSIKEQQKVNFVPKKEIQCTNKCLNIVDKWIARVIVKVPTGNNWNNILSREIALLKVRYPFLTEKQIRGKVFMKFGIPATCGNAIRTGADKITTAVAKEFSQRKKKKARIPAAFKVLKHFIPCIKRVQAKSEMNIWCEENQRAPTLCNSALTFSGEIIHSKKMIKSEEIENFWKRKLKPSIVKNPINKSMTTSHHIPSVVDNASQELSCIVVTPKKAIPNVEQRKTLRSQFNNLNTIFNESTPEDRSYCHIIANDYTKNSIENVENGRIREEPSKRKILSYSQLSPDSRHILDNIQCKFKIENSSDDNNNGIQGHTNEYSSEKLMTIPMEIETDIETNYSFNDSVHSLSQNIKDRHSTFSIKDSPSSHKFSNHKDAVGFQKKFSTDFSYDQNHQCINLSTISKEHINDSIQDMKNLNISNLSRMHSLFASTSFNNKWSPVRKENNEFIVSLPMQRTESSDLMSTSIYKTQYFPSSIHQSSNLSDLWEKMNNQDLNNENCVASQLSRTTCTLTPNINEIFTPINVSVKPFHNQVISQVSVDLLDRANASQLSYSNANSIFNIHSQSNDCNQQCNVFDERKSVMLSDFCCEYDRGWEKLIREKSTFINENDILRKHHVDISMETIKDNIQKVIKILEDCDYFDD